MIAAIDPGRDKCGLVVLDDKQEILEQEILARDKVIEKILKIYDKYNLQLIVLGDGTASEKIKGELEEVGIVIHIIDERNSTLEAKELYWQQNPPCGWRKLIPTSLQMPPQAIDDYAALVLAKRYVK